MGEKRVAIVTGASRGIGRAVAYRLAAQGHAVCVNYVRDAERAAAVVSHIRDNGGVAYAAGGDVSDPSQVAVVVDECATHLGAPTTLVNNAAIFPWTPWQEISPAEWDEVFAVNVRGAWLMSKAVTPFMEAAEWGRIVSMTSATFLTGNPNLMHYAASKGAIVGLTRSLARALGAHNITVNAVSTGKIITEGFEQYFSQGVLNSEEVVASRQSQPIARLGEPEDCASVIAFLTSDEASYLTGQLVNVDGGRNMY
jgi:3-oxoacyl-[acyl-carrier protein] reductase